MQRTNFLTASAIGVVASLAGAGFAGAQTGPGQDESNQGLRMAYGQISEMIDELQADPTDYAGHRVGAIKALQQAKNQLYDALKSRQQVIRGQGGADASIRYAERATTQISQNLKADAHDYGGHRVAAIAALDLAQTQLQKALAVH